MMETQYAACCELPVESEEFENGQFDSEVA